MAHEISGLHAFFHFVGNHIAPVASGKSHDESEVTFFVSGKADGKMFLYFQGNVILGVFHRISVLVGIYAEQREVTCMSRPHPVIGIRTEFTDRRGRCTHHTDVTVSGFNKQVVAVTTIESFQFKLASRCQGNALFGREALGYFLQVFGWQIVCTVWVRIYLQLFVDVVCYIQDFINVSNGKSFTGKLFFAVHCPESICQIVMLHCTVLLDRTIATMMVSQYQSFGRDHFTCATATEVNHCIFQGDAVRIINLVHRD